MKQVEVSRGLGRVGAVVVSLSLVAACGSGSDPLDTLPGTVSQSGGGPGGGPGGGSGDDPTGSTETAGETTEGPTTGSETTGGLVPTRELCDRYLECLAVAQPEALPAAQMGFGANGTCWDGPPEEVEQCITACYTALHKVHEAFPDEPKCNQCEDNGDCVAGERCVFGGCYETYCGDGVVEHDEVCDDEYSCFYNCTTHNYLRCNPFSDAGCEPDEACYFSYLFENSACWEPFEGALGDGADCASDGACDHGLVCLPASELAGCPGAACCTPLCNTQQPDECPNGRVCEPTPMHISTYIGYCVLK